MIGDRLAARTAALLERLGTTVEITHEGLPATSPALVQILGASDRGAAFRTAELTDWLAPAYLVTLAGDGEPVALDDLVTLPAAYPVPGSLRVRKIERVVLGAVPIKTLLFCAATTGASDTSGASAAEGITPEW